MNTFFLYMRRGLKNNAPCVINPFFGHLMIFAVIGFYIVAWALGDPINTVIPLLVSFFNYLILAWMRGRISYKLEQRKIDLAIRTLENE